jgi:N-acetylglutamate synthase-like GNAT family acetyltransferase
VFITRATRHDRGDIAELLTRNGWDAHADRGTTFFARDGAVIGCIRLVEVAPATVVVDDMVVDETRRHQGIGSDLMRAAMNSRGGTLYLRCNDEHEPFYARFGFSQISRGELPEAVRTHMDEDGRGDLYMTAR